MTTHELARLLEHLRDGLGAALQKRTWEEFAEAADALRALPEKSLKDLAKDLQNAAAPTGGGSEQLLARIQSCRAGAGETVDQVMKAVTKLKQPELQAVIRALGQDPGKNKVAENKALVRRFLETALGSDEVTTGPPLSADGVSERLVETGYRQMQELRDTPGLSIESLRGRFAPLRQYPKPVLDGIARKLGYEFAGGKDEVADQLLQTLERMRISQLRGDIIKGSA